MKPSRLRRRLLTGVIPKALVLSTLSAGLYAQDSIEISGRILDGTTGQALPGTVVRLEPEAGGEPVVTASGEDGRYALRAQAPGRYKATASKRGYLRMQLGQSADQPGMVLQVAASQSIKDLDFQLVRSGSISGLISSPEGKPYHKAVVETFRRGSGGLTRIREALSDDLGNYRLAELPPGEYVVRATYGMMALMVDTQYSTGPAPEKPRIGIPTYHGNTTSLEGAIPLKLKPGAEINGVDIQLDEAEPIALRGTVVGENDARVEGMLWLLGTNPPDDCYEMRRAAGVKANTFSFTGLPPGDYLAIGELRSGNTPLTAVQELTITGGEQALEIRAARLPELTASVVWPKNADPVHSLHLHLTPGCYFIGPRPKAAEMDATGVFAFQSVMPVVYELQIEGLPRNYFPKSVENGSGIQLVPGRRIRVLPGANASLRLLLEPGGTSVEGTLKAANAAQVRNVTIEFTRVGATDWLSATPFRKKTDHRGTYSFPGLPPGQYRLSVRGVVDMSDEPRFCHVEPRTASLAAGETKNLDLTLACTPQAPKATQPTRSQQ